MGECGLFLGARQVGSLTWQNTGRGLRLRAACPAEEGYIYRVVIRTEREEQRLGVMLPENGRFTLQKEASFSDRPLRAMIDRTLPGEAHLPGLPLAPSAFTPAKEEDALLHSCGMVRHDLKSADWDELRYLLFPLALGAESPYAPFFCLTTPIQINGGSYGVFCSRGKEYIPLPSAAAETDMLRSEERL